ncbi:MAG: hypothetical protein J7K61_05625 [Thermoplasmata archaeon]|nr:hypothetical protein [Thermoplasmata archaeon]
MIGILTKNFALYHDIITVMRRRAIPFISLTFNMEIPSNVDIIITSCGEGRKINFAKIMECCENDIELFIDKVLLYQMNGRKITFGIDPGKNIGVALFSDGKPIRSFVLSSPETVADYIMKFMDVVDVDKTVVKIGNGARLVRNRIINLLVNSPVKIEMIDESVIAGMEDDESAAILIAMADGREVKNIMPVKAKDGEIKEMQRLSRIRSGNITISRGLAKNVLEGKMNLDEAIEKQRKNQE